MDQDQRRRNQGWGATIRRRGQHHLGTSLNTTERQEADIDDGTRGPQTPRRAAAHPESLPPNSEQPSKQSRQAGPSSIPDIAETGWSEEDEASLDDGTKSPARTGRLRRIFPATWHRCKLGGASSAPGQGFPGLWRFVAVSLFGNRDPPSVGGWLMSSHPECRVVSILSMFLGYSLLGALAEARDLPGEPEMDLRVLVSRRSQDAVVRHTTQAPVPPCSPVTAMILNSPTSP